MLSFFLSVEYDSFCPWGLSVSLGLCAIAFYCFSGTFLHPWAFSCRIFISGGLSRMLPFSCESTVTFSFPQSVPFSTLAFISCRVLSVKVWHEFVHLVVWFALAFQKSSRYDSSSLGSFRRCVCLRSHSPSRRADEDRQEKRSSLELIDVIAQMGSELHLPAASLERCKICSFCARLDTEEQPSSSYRLPIGDASSARSSDLGHSPVASSS